MRVDSIPTLEINPVSMSVKTNLTATFIVSSECDFLKISSPPRQLTEELSHAECTPESRAYFPRFSGEK